MFHFPSYYQQVADASWVFRNTDVHTFLEKRQPNWKKRPFYDKAKVQLFFLNFFKKKLSLVLVSSLQW